MINYCLQNPVSHTFWILFCLSFSIFCFQGIICCLIYIFKGVPSPDVSRMNPYNAMKIHIYMLFLPFALTIFRNRDINENNSNPMER